MKFLPALMGLLMFTAVRAESDPSLIRVLCWNLHHGVGEDGKLDLERIAKVIREAKPDLVALQEVDQKCGRSGGIDQAAELARLTGMEGLFGKAMDFDGGGYGQAILSRHRLTDSKVHRLPGSAEPRIAFEVSVVVDGVAVRFISTHLGLTEKERLPQVATLAKLGATEPGPLILCGDFNDVPASPALAVMKEPWQPVAKTGPVFTHPAGNPKVEIDHFFSHNSLWTATATVLPEAVASDHRPILAVFTKSRQP